VTRLLIVLTFSLTAATVFSSCGSDLRSIDERTARLVRERSAQLGPEATPPSPRTGDVRVEKRPALFDKNPPTVNPPAAALHYQVLDPAIADEAAEVEARLAAIQTIPDDNALHLDLTASLRQAQRTAREFLNAEEDYILAAIRLLIERHDWSPRLFHSASADFTSTQDDGHSDTVLRILNELRATQRLPYGGEIAARWIFDATENLRTSVTGQYVQASSLLLDASIPLLRDAGLIAQEGLIQAERDLVYAARDFEAFRRRFLVDIARDYFNLLQQLAAIENTRKQLESLRRQLDRETALYHAGRIAEFRVNIVRNDLLSATSSLAAQREAYILALDRFKIRLGLPVSTPVVIVPSQLDIPEPDISLEGAVEAALAYRLDLQNARDRLDDALRAVRNARNQLLPDLDLRASAGLRTDPDEREGGFVYELDDASYAFGVTFGLPLDREVERLQLRRTTIAYQQAVRDYERFRDNVVLEVRAQVREIERARFALLLEEERVKINERRQLEQSLKPAEVTSQELVDTENALNAARNARDQAVTDLRNAILDYLVVTGQLRVARDGTFIPLPGMDRGRPAPDPAPDAEPPAFPPPPPGVPTVEDEPR